jgi:tRNA dimethylallyltransferase
MDIGTGKVLPDQRPTTNDPRQEKDISVIPSEVPNNYEGRSRGISGDFSTPSNITLESGRNDKKVVFISEKIRHYMIDIVSPNTPYSVAKFQKKANTAIKDIFSRGKLPILCGGTGLWAQAVVENMSFPKILPDSELRNHLRNASAKELFAKLQILDPDRTQTIDLKNRHRLIRAIEIALSGYRVQGTGYSKRKISNLKSQELPTPIPSSLSPVTCHLSPVTWLIIAVNPPRETLFTKIEKRLDERLRNGMIDEVQSLHHDKHVSWARLNSFGLEYRWISRFLRKTISYDEMREKLLIDIRHYAKRQLTWLRRWEKLGRKIHWVVSQKEAKEIAKTFLK